MKKVTMQEAVFYRLYQAFKDEKTRERYIPVHEFMGEIFVKETGQWGYVSYERSARLSEMRRDNPGLLQREYITGKSGARFYGYRLAPNARRELIKDEKLLAFHKRIGPKQQPAMTREQVAEHNRAMEEVWNSIPEKQHD